MVDRLGAQVPAMQDLEAPLSCFFVWVRALYHQPSTSKTLEREVSDMRAR